MDRADSIWLWVLTALAFLAAALRLLLTKKQGAPMSGFRLVQNFVFPAILLVASVLFQTGTADIVFPAVLIGVEEELICGAVRKRKAKQQ